MKKIEVSIDKSRCDEDMLNKIETSYWKNIFEKRKPIPSPHINYDNEIVAFHNCFFVLKDLGLSKIWCVLID